MKYNKKCKAFTSEKYPKELKIQICQKVLFKFCAFLPIKKSKGWEMRRCQNQWPKLNQLIDFWTLKDEFLAWLSGFILEISVVVWWRWRCRGGGSAGLAVDPELMSTQSQCEDIAKSCDGTVLGCVGISFVNFAFEFFRLHSLCFVDFDVLNKGHWLEVKKDGHDAQL